MIVKIVFLAIAAAATGASLLSVRQQRVQAAHEMAALHERLETKEEALSKLRLAIAERLTPRDIQRLIAAIEEARGEELAPVRFEWCAPYRRRATRAGSLQRVMVPADEGTG